MKVRETTLWDHPPTLTLRKPGASGNLESGYAQRAERSLTMPSGGDRRSCRAVTNVYTERLSRPSHSPNWGLVVCFDGTFQSLHAMACNMHEEPVMLKIKLHNLDTSVEPTPRFASDAEIQLAEQMRYLLEERYFGPSAIPSPLQTRSGEGH